MTGKSWERLMFERLSHDSIIEYKMHKGEAFRSKVTFTLLNGETKVLHGKVDSSDKNVVMIDRKVVITDSAKAIDVSLELSYDAILTSEGTGVSIFNLDMNKDLTNNIFINQEDAIYSDQGTIVSNINYLADKGSITDLPNPDRFYTMKRESDYILEFTNNAISGSVEVTVSWIWYVEDIVNLA